MSNYAARPLARQQGKPVSLTRFDSGAAALCVICEKPLRLDRKHVDTCGDRCFRSLLRIQRRSNEHEIRS